MPRLYETFSHRFFEAVAFRDERTPVSHVNLFEPDVHGNRVDGGSPAAMGAPRRGLRIRHASSAGSPGGAESRPRGR